MRRREYKQWSSMERRHFLRSLSLLLAAPLVPLPLRWRCLAYLEGEAYAEKVASPFTYFLEVNYRDQWDFGSVFAAPSLAKNYASLPKEGRHSIAYFEQPTEALAGKFYITPAGKVLEKHLDSIAVMELGEVPIGSVHGHEASNALRSPGRSAERKAGQEDMANVDERPNGRVQGNEIHFSSSPTPAIFHNYYQKLINPDIANGILLRNSIRSFIHTFYHFDAGLRNSQLNRFFERDSLIRAFAPSKLSSDKEGIPDKHRALLVDLIKRVDGGYLGALEGDHPARLSHLESLTATGRSKALPANFDLALSPKELSHWTTGIPSHMDCPSDIDITRCMSNDSGMNIGEMFGYVSKLFSADVIRSAAVDFGGSDIHTERNEAFLKVQGTQTAEPLARLIESLKAAGIYDRTVIALYTLDGSRSPRRVSNGDGSKNGIILAGGMVRGGYYGDIRIKDDQEIYYHPPGEDGQPLSEGVRDGSKRVAGHDIYASVAQAMGVPSKALAGFQDIAPGRVLRYLLK